MAIQAWLNLAAIDPELEAFMKQHGTPPPIVGDIPVLRAALSARKKELTAAQGSVAGASGVRERDEQVATSDGSAITVRIYSPESPPSNGSPLIVFLHGGGWCLGGLENEELFCRNFVKEFGAVAVNVDYRLAPEHPFPTGPNDCWDAFRWAAANASKLGADPSKGFIVGGTSAGGNIAAVTARRAGEEKFSPPLTGLALLIPALIDYRDIPDAYKDDVQSYEQNKDAPILGLESVKLFMGHYNPSSTSPLFNIFVPPADFSNFPPTFFQICGMDPLRDEALVFERCLREDAKVQTKLMMYPGLPHGFWSFFTGLEVSKRFVKETNVGVGWLLERV